MDYNNNENWLNQVFVARTHHRRIIVGSADAPTGSRMGGKPPSRLASSPPKCACCGGPLEYVLTIGNDIVGDQIAHGNFLSMLCCRRLECLWRGREIVAPSPIALVFHPEDRRADSASEIDSTSDGRILTLGPVCEDPVDEYGSVDTDRSKLGGGPGYIQAWGDEQTARARSDGRCFLFQWCETDHPRDMDRGTYPFCGGVVYLFSRFSPATILPELAGTTAFWQST